ncbi:MAG: putative sulfate exporter family transporter, partial [Blastocatellia bacterium]|nr:putative sulfate exporter family transporter [Blastocatellia bacterium]
EVWGSQYLLGTAMAAVGLGTNFSVFKSVGLKPFAVGFVGALLVGVVGLGLALTLGPYVHL